MVRLEVGDKFPFPVRRRDGMAPMLDGASLSFIVHTANVTPEEAAVFRRGAVRYGVLDARSIPVIFIDWPDFAGFDCHLNSRKEPPEKLERFLTDEANLLTLYFVDWQTGMLHGIRVLGSPLDYLAEIKKICRDSLMVYGTAELLDKAADAFFAKYSTPWIVAESRMIKSEPSVPEEEEL
jgi:hypothetical protein